MLASNVSNLNSNKLHVNAVLAWSALVVFYLYRLNDIYADPDLFGYLSFARLWHETGLFPYVDAFAYTPTRPVWVYHEWLTGVLYYSVVRLFSFEGLKVLKFVLGLATLFILYSTARLRKSSGVAVFFILFVISPAFSFGYSCIRAQVLTNIFFVLLVYVFERVRIRQDRRLLFLVPLLFVVWCNIHAGFVLGLCVLFVYVVSQCRDLRRMLPYGAVFVASACATLINPYGVEYWSYLIEALTMPRPEITEWYSLVQSFSVESLVAVSCSFLMVLFLCLIFFRPRNEKSRLQLFLLVFAGVIGILHVRHQVFLFLLAGAYLPQHLDKFWNRLTARHQDIAARWKRIGTLLAPALLLCMAVSYGYAFMETPFLTLRPEEATDGDRLSIAYQPVGAVRFMRDKAYDGKLLTEFTWGEYLTWELYPAIKVAFDGRYETVYQDDFAKKYFACLYHDEGIESFLKEYPPDLVLVRPFRAMHIVLRAKSEWVELYRDSGSVLMGRRDRFVVSEANPCLDR